MYYLLRPYRTDTVCLNELTLMFNLLQIAAKAALPNHDFDQRNFWVGAAGIRGRDNVIVSARNGACAPNAHGDEFQTTPEAHAEARLIKKLGKYGIIAVCRIRKLDGRWAMARPCMTCNTQIRSARARKVIYSINDDYYGIWDIERDEDRILRFRR